MNYYITGANGFIGKALCERLTGHIYKHDRKEGIKPYELRHADVIFHLSAYGNHSTQTDIRQIIKSNIDDLRELLDFTRLVPFKKFYNISSSSVTLPNQTAYSASKLIGEELVNDCNDERMVNVRPYSVYGPGEAQFRFIPKVIRHLLSGEEMIVDRNAVHDWIFIDDFITAMLNGETEIGTGEQHSNEEIVYTLERISGKRLNDKQGVLRSYDCGNWKALKGVDHISLKEGLRKTYEYYAKR